MLFGALVYRSEHLVGMSILEGCFAGIYGLPKGLGILTRTLLVPSNRGIWSQIMGT